MRKIWVYAQSAISILYWKLYHAQIPLILLAYVIEKAEMKEIKFDHSRKRFLDLKLDLKFWYKWNIYTSISALPLCFLNKYYGKERINIASSSLVYHYNCWLILFECYSVIRVWFNYSYIHKHSCCLAFRILLPYVHWFLFFPSNISLCPFSSPGELL